MCAAMLRLRSLKGCVRCGRRAADSPGWGASSPLAYPAAETVLLLSRKGSELTFTELGASGASTGLLRTQRFHCAALSGLVVDAQVQALYLLQAAPQAELHRFELGDGAVGADTPGDARPAGNVSLRTADGGAPPHVWNAAAWEARGTLLAISPSASGPTTSRKGMGVARPT